MRSGFIYRNLEISEYESVIMTENVCSGFLEMRCVFDGDIVEVFYDTNGYRTMDEVMTGGFSKASDILELCVIFLRAVSLCTDHMISEKELSFRDTDIFCSSELSRVKLRFIPGAVNEVSVREKLVMMADTAMDYYGDQPGVVELMSTYKKRLYAKKYSLNELIGMTESCARSTRKPVSSVREDRDDGSAVNQGEERLSVDFMKRKVEQGVKTKFESFIKGLVS